MDINIQPPKPPAGTLNVPAKDLPSPSPKDSKDFRDSMQWRIFRIMAEFVEGFEFLAGLKKSVTIFGSARDSGSTHQWYEESRRLGEMLAKDGFTVVTGGGPGIMEGANRGAAEAQGEAVGLNIQLAHEQRINPYVNRALGFHYFFTRKLMLTYSAQAFVYFPGGFGTLDEFFEIVTLIQTKKISKHIPVILVGKEFWGPFDQWVRTVMYQRDHAIDEDDIGIYTIVDTPEEVMAIVKAMPLRDLSRDLSD